MYDAGIVAPRESSWIASSSRNLDYTNQTMHLPKFRRQSGRHSTTGMSEEPIDVQSEDDDDLAFPATSGYVLELLFVTLTFSY